MMIFRILTTFLSQKKPIIYFIMLHWNLISIRIQVIANLCFEQQNHGEYIFPLVMGR